MLDVALRFFEDEKADAQPFGHIRHDRCEQARLFAIEAERRLAQTLGATS